MPTTASQQTAYSVALLPASFPGLALGRVPACNSSLGEHLSPTLPAAPGAWHCATNHPSWTSIEEGFHVVEIAGVRAIEARGESPGYENRILIAGDENWRDYRLRATVTPLGVHSGNATSAAGGLYGIAARYQDSRTYLALVLDRDGRLKILKRSQDRFEVLADAALAAAPGTPLEFLLTVSGSKVTGEVQGVALSADLDGYPCGKVGLLSDLPARFEKVSVESAEREATRLEKDRARERASVSRRIAKFPSLRLERRIPLNRLVHGRHLRLADLNGDGKPEIILAQGSPTTAKDLRLTRLTCLSVLDLEGKLLWQAGVPDPDAPLMGGDLPFQVYDIFGDGRPAVICAFGYDLQIRDGRSGKVLWSISTPETTAVGNDFKEVTGAWGAPWGDETLNVDIAQIGFCNTQGRSFAREILIKDDHHHLAVLDIEPVGATTLIKHRGVHGHAPWCGDIDGDGCDEILAGYSLLDHTGQRRWSLHLGDHPQASAVLDPLAPGGKEPQIFLCGGADGLLKVGLDGAIQRLGQVHAQRLGIAKFREDLPGLQLATVSAWGNPGIVQLHDATGKLLWSKELPLTGGLALPVNWTGRSEELLLHSLAPGAGLFDGHGELCAEAPASGPFNCCDTTPYFSADGRDSLIAWDSETLAVYVPSDAPLKGAKANSVYRPTRPGAVWQSSYRAGVSLPPGW